MKKFKTLKSLLLPCVGIATLIPFAAISTSCTGDQNGTKVSKLVGGNVELKSEFGRGGSDPKKWSLFVNDVKIDSKKVNWTIENNPDESISIEDGCISWAKDTPSGEYNLVVKGSCFKVFAFSQKISLKINSVYNFKDNSKKTKEILSWKGYAGEHEKSFTLTKDNQVIDNSSIEWELICDESLKDIIKFENSKISWSEKISIGKYELQIRAKYDNKVFDSEKMILGTYKWHYWYLNHYFK